MSSGRLPGGATRASDSVRGEDEAQTGEEEVRTFRSFDDTVRGRPGGTPGSVLRLAGLALVAAWMAGCSGDGNDGTGSPEDADAAREPAHASGEMASAEGAAVEAGEQAAGTFPEGWKIRTDPGKTAPGAVHFVRTEAGVRVRPGPRAIYWRAGDTLSAPYRVAATFTRLNEPRFAESYGLFVAGRELEGEGQRYLYFLVRQDGKFLVKRRAGAETATLAGWSAHAAVRKREGTGPTNRLEVRAGSGGELSFLVNGTPVWTGGTEPALRTEGIAGIRVNHRLDVEIEDFDVARAPGGG